MRGLFVRSALTVALFACGTSPDLDNLFPRSDAAPLANGDAEGAVEAGGDVSRFEGDAEPEEGAAAGGGASDQGGPDAPTLDARQTDVGVMDTGSGGSIRDAAVDARPDGARDAGDGGGAPTIRCGTAQCDVATELCCTEAFGKTRCLKRNQAPSCPKNVARLECDERSDCATGQVCCLHYLPVENRDDAVCTSNCAGQPLCDAARASTCSAGTSCRGKSVAAGYDYCM